MISSLPCFPVPSSWVPLDKTPQWSLPKASSHRLSWLNQRNQSQTTSHRDPSKACVPGPTPLSLSVLCLDLPIWPLWSFKTWTINFSTSVSPVVHCRRAAGHHLSLCAPLKKYKSNKFITRSLMAPDLFFIQSALSLDRTQAWVGTF